MVFPTSYSTCNTYYFQISYTLYKYYKFILSHTSFFLSLCQFLKALFSDAAFFMLSSNYFFLTWFISSLCTSNISSSCTWRISLDFKFLLLSSLYTFTIAILIISAALPCIGVFSATLSPKDLILKLFDFYLRYIPSSVKQSGDKAFLPCFFFMFVIYSLTLGYFSKYSSI